MYRISELAEMLGLSRTTLLYYEKIELIKGQRLSNGYRAYSDADLTTLAFDPAIAKRRTDAQGV